VRKVIYLEDGKLWRKAIVTEMEVVDKNEA